MKENRGTEAGLVTRLDEKFIYVWWKKQHLDELVFIRSINPEITCGDIVTFEVSPPSTEVQEGAKLTLLPNHCFTIHIPQDNPSTCWVRTNVILPPEGCTYFAEQEKYCKKEGKRLQFMAFSKEFGSVACCIRMDHKPDTVYSCVIGRMPTKFDSKLKKKLDTLFFITEHGIKENTDAEEVSRIRKVAPWNLETTIRRNGQVDSWVNSKAQTQEVANSHEVDCSQTYEGSIISIEMPSSETVVQVPSVAVAAISKESQAEEPVASLELSRRRPSISSVSIVSAISKPKIINWVEDEEDLNSMSMDCLTKCLGMKLPERTDPVHFEQKSEEPEMVLGGSASFSGLPKLARFTSTVEEEQSHGKNFDMVWDTYKKLRGRGLFLEAATLKKRYLELCMEYEFLLAKHNI